GRELHQGVRFENALLRRQKLWVLHSDQRKRSGHIDGDRFQRLKIPERWRDLEILVGIFRLCGGRRRRWQVRVVNIAQLDAVYHSYIRRRLILLIAWWPDRNRNLFFGPAFLWSGICRPARLA